MTEFYLDPTEATFFKMQQHLAQSHDAISVTPCPPPGFRDELYGELFDKVQTLRPAAYALDLGSSKLKDLCVSALSEVGFVYKVKSNTFSVVNQTRRCRRPRKKKKRSRKKSGNPRASSSVEQRVVSDKTPDCSTEMLSILQKLMIDEGMDVAGRGVVTGQHVMQPPVPVETELPRSGPDALSPRDKDFTDASHQSTIGPDEMASIDLGALPDRNVVSAVEDVSPVAVSATASEMPQVNVSGIVGAATAVAETWSFPCVDDPDPGGSTVRHEQPSQLDGSNVAVNVMAQEVTTTVLNGANQSDDQVASDMFSDAAVGGDSLAVNTASGCNMPFERHTAEKALRTRTKATLVKSLRKHTVRQLLQDAEPTHDPLGLQQLSLSATMPKDPVLSPGSTRKRDEASHSKHNMEESGAAKQNVASESHAETSRSTETTPGPSSNSCALEAVPQSDIETILEQCIFEILAESRIESEGHVPCHDHSPATVSMSPEMSTLSCDESVGHTADPINNLTDSHRLDATSEVAMSAQDMSVLPDNCVAAPGAVSTSLQSDGVPGVSADDLVMMIKTSLKPCDDLANDPCETERVLQVPSGLSIDARRCDTGYTNDVVPDSLNTYHKSSAGLPNAIVTQRRNLQNGHVSTSDEDGSSGDETNHVTFKCRFCKHAFESLSRRRQHQEWVCSLRSDTVKTSVGEHVCLVCGASFKKRPGLNRHILIMHPEAISADEDAHDMKPAKLKTSKVNAKKVKSSGGPGRKKKLPIKGMFEAFNRMDNGPAPNTLKAPNEDGGHARNTLKAEDVQIDSTGFSDDDATMTGFDGYDGSTDISTDGGDEWAENASFYANKTTAVECDTERLAKQRRHSDIGNVRLPGEFRLNQCTVRLARLSADAIATYQKERVVDPAVKLIACDNLRTHDSSNGAVLPCLCDLCGDGFPDVDTLEDHFLDEHHMTVVLNTAPKIQNELFLCEFCSEFFARQSRLNAHVKKLHGNAVKPSTVVGTGNVAGAQGEHSTNGMVMGNYVHLLQTNIEAGFVTQHVLVGGDNLNCDGAMNMTGIPGVTDTGVMTVTGVNSVAYDKQTDGSHLLCQNVDVYNPSSDTALLEDWMRAQEAPVHNPGSVDNDTNNADIPRQVIDSQPYAQFDMPNLVSTPEVSRSSIAVHVSGSLEAPQHGLLQTTMIRIINVERFQCKACSAEFGTAAAFKVHSRTKCYNAKAIKVTAKTYVCHFCGLVCSNILHCREHVYREHPSAALSAEGNNVCGDETVVSKTTKSISTLPAVVSPQTVSGVTGNVPLISDSSIVKTTSSQRDVIDKFPSRVFNRARKKTVMKGCVQLRGIHMYAVKTAVCGACHQMCTNKQVLSAPQLCAYCESCEPLEVTILYQCLYCEEMFSSKTACRFHEISKCMLLHGSARMQFACDTCSMSYSRRQDLRKHLKKHERGEVMLDSQTEAEFISAHISGGAGPNDTQSRQPQFQTVATPVSELGRHQCPTCSLGFTAATPLKLHMLNEHGYAGTNELRKRKRKRLMNAMQGDKQKNAALQYGIVAERSQGIANGKHQSNFVGLRDCVSSAADVARYAIPSVLNQNICSVSAGSNTVSRPSIPVMLTTTNTTGILTNGCNTRGATAPGSLPCATLARHAVMVEPPPAVIPADVTPFEALSDKATQPVSIDDSVQMLLDESARDDGGLSTSILLQLADMLSEQNDKRDTAPPIDPNPRTEVWPQQRAQFLLSETVEEMKRNLDGRSLLSVNEVPSSCSEHTAVVVQNLGVIYGMAADGVYGSSVSADPRKDADDGSVSEEHVANYKPAITAVSECGPAELDTRDISKMFTPLKTDAVCRAMTDNITSDNVVCESAASDNDLPTVTCDTADVREFSPGARYVAEGDESASQFAESDETSPGNELDETSPGNELDETSPGNELDETSPGNAVDETSPGNAVDETSPGNEVDETSRGNPGDETSPGNEVDEASPGDDVEETSPGDEVEEISPGDDVEETSPGDDVEEISPGDEVEEISPGDDVEEISPGDDVEETSPGDDVEEISPGDEVEEISPGDDVEETSPGDDVEETSPGDDVEETSPGDDVEETSPGDDVEEISPGDDVEEISPGDDVEETSPGDDVEEISPGDEVEEISPGDDVEETSPGDDVEEISPGDEVEEISPGDDVEETSPGDDVEEISPGDDVEEISPGDDVEEISPGDDVEETSPGDDVEEISPGDDVEETSPGDDVEEISPGDEVEEISPGDDVEETSPGDDVEETSPGDDVDETSPGNEVDVISPGDETSPDDSTMPHTAPISPIQDVVDRFLRLTDGPEEKEPSVPVTMDLPGRLSDVPVWLDDCSTETAVVCQTTTDALTDGTAVVENSSAVDEAESMAVDRTEALQEDNFGADRADPTAVKQDNFDVDKLKHSDVEDNLGVDRTNSTAVKEDNLGVDRPEHITVKEDNLGVDRTEPITVKEDNLGIDRTEPITVKEDNLGVDRTEPIAVKEDNLGVDRTEPIAVKEDNLGVDRTEPIAVKEDNFGVDRTEPIAVKEDNLGVDRTEPITVKEDNLGVDRTEPITVKEDNLGVDRTEPITVKEDNLGVDRTEPITVKEDNLGVDRTEPIAVKEDNLGVDRTKPIAVKEVNLGVDRTEPIAVKEDNLGVDQPEPITVKEDNLGVDRTEPIALKEDNLGVDRTEPIAVKEDNLGVDRTEPITVKEDNLGVDRTEPITVKEDNLGVDRTEPIAVKEDNLGVDRTEPITVKEDNLGVDRTEPITVKEDNLGVDRTEPITVKEDNLGVDRTEPIAVKEDNLGVDRTEPIAVKEDNLGVDRTEPIAVKEDNLGVDRTEPITVKEDNLGVDRTEPITVKEDNLGVDRTEPITVKEDNLGVDRTETTSFKEDNLDVDQPEPIALKEDNLGVDQPEPIALKGDNLGVDQPEPIALKEDNLGVDRTETTSFNEDTLDIDLTKPTTVAGNMGVDQTKHAIVQDNLAVDLTKPAGIVDNLAVDLTTPATVEEDLAVDLTKPTTAEDNSNVYQTKPAGVDDNLAVDLTKPAGFGDNLGVDQTQPRTVEEDLALDLTKPPCIEDNLAVDQIDTFAGDNLAVDLRKPASVEDSLAVDPAAFEDNSGVEEPESTTVDVSESIATCDPTALVVVERNPAVVNESTATYENETSATDYTVQVPGLAGLGGGSTHRNNTGSSSAEPASEGRDVASLPKSLDSEILEYVGDGCIVPEASIVGKEKHSEENRQDSDVDQMASSDVESELASSDNDADANQSHKSCEVTDGSNYGSLSEATTTDTTESNDGIVNDLVETLPRRVKPASPVYICEQCTPCVTYFRRYSLQLHQKNVHGVNGSDDEMPRERLVCPICHAAPQFNAVLDLQCHMKWLHGVKNPSVASCAAAQGVVGGKGKTVSVKGETVCGKGETVSGKGKTVGGKGGTVGVKGKTVSGKGETVSGKGKTVSGKNETVSGKGGTVSCKGGTVGGKGGTVGVKGKTVSGKGETVSGKGKTVSGKNETVSGKGGTVSCKGGTVSGKGGTVSNKGKTVSGKGGAVSGKGETVSDKGEAVSGKGKTVGGKGKTVGGKDETVGGKGKTVSGKGETVGGKGKTVGGKGKTVSGKGKTVSGKGETVSGKGETVCDDEYTGVEVEHGKADFAELDEGLSDDVSARDDVALDVNGPPGCVSDDELQGTTNATEDVDAAGTVTMSHDSHKRNTASSGVVADDAKQGKHDQGEDVAEPNDVADSTLVADECLNGKADTAKQPKNSSTARKEYCMRVRRTKDVSLRTKGGAALAKSKMQRMKLKHCVKTKRNTDNSRKIRPTGGLRTRSGAELPERLPPSRVYAVNTEGPSVHVDHQLPGDSSSSVKGDSSSPVKGDSSSSVKGDSSSSVKGDSSSPVKVHVGSRRSVKVSPRCNLRSRSGMMSPEILPHATSLKTGVKSKAETRRLSHGDRVKHGKCAMKTPLRRSSNGSEPSVTIIGGLRTRSGVVLPERTIPSRSVISKSEIASPMAPVTPNEMNLLDDVESSNGLGAAPALDSIETKLPSVVPTVGECQHRMPRKESEATEKRISCASEESQSRDVTDGVCKSPSSTVPAEKQGDHSESVDLLPSCISHVETSEKQRDGNDNLQDGSSLNTPGITEIFIGEQGSSDAKSIIQKAEQSDASAQKRRSCSPAKESRMNDAEMSHNLPGNLNSLISVRDIVEAVGEGRPMAALVAQYTVPPRKILRVVHVREAAATDGGKLKCISEMNDEAVSNKRCLTPEKKQSTRQTLRSAKRTCLRVKILKPEEETDVSLSSPESSEQTESGCLEKDVDALDCPPTTPLYEGVTDRDTELCSIHDKRISMNETGDLYIDLVAPFESVEETKSSVDDEWVTKSNTADNDNESVQETKSSLEDEWNTKRNTADNENESVQETKSSLEDELTTKSSTADNEKVHTTEVLERVYASLDELLPHPVTGVVYECQLCGEQYTRRYLLVRHMSRIHKVMHTSWRRFCEDTETILVNEEPWRCTLCRKQFMMIREWRTHMAVKHNVQSAQYDAGEVARSKPAVEMTRPTMNQGDAEPTRSGDSIDEITPKRLRESSGEREVNSDTRQTDIRETVAKERHVSNDDDNFGFLNTVPQSAFESQWLKMNKTLPRHETKRRPVPSSSLPWLSEEAQTKEKAQANVCYGKRPKQVSDFKLSFDDSDSCAVSSGAETGEDVVISQPIRHPPSSVDALPSPTRQLVSHDSKQRNIRRVRSLHTVVQRNARSSKSRSVSQDAEQRNGQADKVSSIEKRTVQSMSSRTSTCGTKPHRRSYSGTRAASVIADTKKDRIGKRSSKHARVDSQRERNARHRSSSRRRDSSPLVTVKSRTPHSSHSAGLLHHRDRSGRYATSLGRDSGKDMSKSNDSTEMSRREHTLKRRDLSDHGVVTCRTAPHSRNRHSSGATPHRLHPQKSDRRITSPDNSPTRTRRSSTSEQAGAPIIPSSESRTDDLACKKTKRSRDPSSCVDSSVSSRIHSHGDVPAESSSSHSCKPHCRTLSKRSRRSNSKESMHAVATSGPNVARRNKRSASEDVGHLRQSLEEVSFPLLSELSNPGTKSGRRNSHDAMTVSAPSTTLPSGAAETGKTTDLRSSRSESVVGSRLSKRRRTLPDLFGVPLNSSYIT